MFPPRRATSFLHPSQCHFSSPLPPHPLLPLAIPQQQHLSSLQQSTSAGSKSRVSVGLDIYYVFISGATAAKIQRYTNCRSLHTTSFHLTSSAYNQLVLESHLRGQYLIPLSHHHVVHNNISGFNNTTTKCRAGKKLDRSSGRGQDQLKLSSAHPPSSLQPWVSGA